MIRDEAYVHAEVESALGADGEPLLSLLRPSLRLVPCDDDACNGPVRFGGPGILGPDESWPAWNGSPLTFLAAFDCEAVHALLPESPLPDSGTVTVWVHRIEDGFPEHLIGGPTSGQHDASRLIHHPPGIDLHEEGAPEGVPWHNTVPVMRAVERDVMWSFDLFRRYSDPSRFGVADRHVDVARRILNDAADPRSGALDRIGGWPVLEHAAESVALVDAGIVDEGGRPAHKAHDAAAVMANAPFTWRPLVQLDADLDLGWNWFLDGVLIFLGRAGDPPGSAMAYCSRT